MRAANSTRSRLTHDRVMRCGMTLLVVTITFALAACSGSTSASTAPTATATPPTAATALPPVPRRLASSDPVQLADDLVADEQALCDPKSSEVVLMGAAGRQQAAYRALGRHPEWDVIARPRIAASLLNVYDRNVDAQRQFTAIVASEPKDTLPAWRIDPPAPTNKLLGYYREAEAATGVGWNYLAAINLIETGLGRVVGVSDAGAQGPMQFLPSTFADYGDGGDILSPHDTSWRPVATSPPTASPTTTTTPCFGITTGTGTSGRSTTTSPCSQPIPLVSPAITGGISTTTRLLVTCSCPSDTWRPHRSP